MTWVQDRLGLIVIFGGICLALGVAAIVISFLAAFWLNGLYGYKFEWGTCWQGFGAVATGVGTLWTVAQAAMKKYEIDSRLNSKRGEMPKGDTDGTGNA